jgi:hypothetical protein
MTCDIFGDISCLETSISFTTFHFDDLLLLRDLIVTLMAFSCFETLFSCYYLPSCDSQSRGGYVVTLRVFHLYVRYCYYLFFLIRLGVTPWPRCPPWVQGGGLPSDEITCWRLTPVVYIFLGCPRGICFLRRVATRSRRHRSRDG